MGVVEKFSRAQIYSPSKLGQTKNRRDAPATDPLVALRQVFGAISRYAEEFRREHGQQRVITIVIDNVNELLPQNRIPFDDEKQEAFALNLFKA